ncbi:MAG: alkaline phosphatase family protein [Isosphaeraceae bacterium]
MAERVVLLSIPQLRHKDVTPGALASLDRMAGRGALAELVPAFPGLAASSFATLMTGTGPYEHGLIGNSYYDRAEGRVRVGPLPDSVVQAPRLWDRLRAVKPGARSMLWFAPNFRGATVDLGAWVESDWQLATEPPALAKGLLDRFGPFPSPVSRGEPPRLEVSTWLLKAAAQVIADEQPTLAVVRVPYLGQVARRFGPDGREAGRAIRELESILAPFLATLDRATLTIAVTESVTTPVSGPIYPNRVLRGLGLLALKPDDKGGLAIDLGQSAAFALADHQVCHIYLNDPDQAATIASAFAGAHNDGVDTVAPGAARAGLGLDHPRAGDVVLVACPDRWFAPDWWLTAEEAPKSSGLGSALISFSTDIPLDPTHVKGSLGAPPPNADYLGVIVASQPNALGSMPQVSARDVAQLVLRNWEKSSDLT